MHYLYYRVLCLLVMKMGHLCFECLTNEVIWTRCFAMNAWAADNLR